MENPYDRPIVFARYKGPGPGLPYLPVQPAVLHFSCEFGRKYYSSLPTRPKCASSLFSLINDLLVLPPALPQQVRPPCSESSGHIKQHAVQQANRFINFKRPLDGWRRLAFARRGASSGRTSQSVGEDRMIQSPSGRQLCVPMCVREGQ